MAILWGFESLPDAVSRFCSDFLEFGTNPAIFKDLSYGCKGSGNTSCLGCQKLSKTLTQQPSQDLWSNASLDIVGPTSAACGSLLLVLDSFRCCHDSTFNTVDDCRCPTCPPLHNQGVRCLALLCALFGMVSWMHFEKCGTNLPSSMALFGLHCLLPARLNDCMQPCKGQCFHVYTHI